MGKLAYADWTNAKTKPRPGYEITAFFHATGYRTWLTSCNTVGSWREKICAIQSMLKENLIDNLKKLLNQ